MGILNEHLEEKGLAQHKLDKKLPGSSEAIRKHSQNKIEHFELYSSIVHGNVDGSKVEKLELDVEIYEEQIESQQEELEAWNKTYEIMLEDKVRLERIIAKLHEDIANHDQKVKESRMELLAEI